MRQLSFSSAVSVKKSKTVERGKSSVETRVIFP